MRVRWLASARHSLRLQLAYIADSDPSAAVRLRVRIHDAVRHLGDFPSIGRGGEIAGTKELVVPGLRFLIVYRLGPETVDILRVLHTSTNWRGVECSS